MTNDRGQVNFAKMGLSTLDLEVMALHFYHGWSYKQIGDLLGIVKQSVKDRVDKCRRILTKNSIPLPKKLEHPRTSRTRVIQMGDATNAYAVWYDPEPDLDGE